MTSLLVSRKNKWCVYIFFSSTFDEFQDRISNALLPENSGNQNPEPEQHDLNFWRDLTELEQPDKIINWKCMFLFRFSFPEPTTDRVFCRSEESRNTERS